LESNGHLNGWDTNRSEGERNRWTERERDEGAVVGNERISGKKIMIPKTLQR